MTMEYISSPNLAQLITNVSSFAFDLLRCRDDLADDEKQAIRILQGRLRFFRVVVQLAESSEGMVSLLNCIHDYTCKVDIMLSCFRNGKPEEEGGRDPLLSALMQRGINCNEPCSILIILDVFKISKKMLLGQGLAWVLASKEVLYLDGGLARILIWEYTIEWIYQIIDDDFSKELLDWISSLIVQWESGTQLLHEGLTFLASFVRDPSFDMKLVVVRAATFLGLVYAFSFGDLSEEVIEIVNLQLSALVTSLNVIKAEVSLIKLMSHDSSLIILMMPQLKELQVFFKFLIEHFTDMEDEKTGDKAPLVSQSKALVSETVSFLELLVEHEMEEDTCTEINPAFLKLLGTKLIQVHVLALELLNCDKKVVSQMDGQLVKLCDKLGSLVENFDFNNVNLQLSAHVIKAEVSLMKLLSHDSSLIILMMMPQLKELQDFLEFLRKHFTDKEPLMSQSKATVSETLSFLELLVKHEMDEDICTEITLAVLKLLGTTKFIQAHVLALELLNCDKNVNVNVNNNENQMEGLLVKLCEKLGSLVKLMENLDVSNNENQILFLLDTGAVAIKAVSLVSLFSMGITEERLKEGNTHFLKLIADIELLEAGLMLNCLFNHHVDVIVHFGKIEMLRNVFRLLRTILMDSTEPASNDKILLARSVEWASEATQLVSLLFHNRSNEDMTMEMNDSVSLLLERMNDLETDVTADYLQIRRSSQSAHPRTDRLGFFDCLVDNLSNLSGSVPTFYWMKYQIRRASKDLKSSRSLLNDILWEHNEDDELNNLVSRLTQAAYEVEYVTEAFLIGDSMTWNKRLWISKLIDEIKQISMEITDILSNRPYNDNRFMTSRRVLLPVHDPSTNEVVVGMKEQEEKAINQLTRGSTKLGIVSIVGMGGLGKTTLANKVFNAPSVRNSFDVRAWCCISKVYQKREILLDLLGYVIEITPKILKMTDDDLSNRLRQLLLERTYLIVMDDIWDIGAWKELQQSFPKDEKRSRILLTSRSNDIASKTGYGFEPCSLDFLSDKECWELLERKLFEAGSCPLQFREVGWEIAVNCKGLPLAVVVISGLLSAKEMNLDWWKQVAGNLNSFVVGNSKIFTNIIDLSYRYLPDYLKPCFLYLGAFQEDEKIIVSNLIHLWTAEGFIPRNDDKNLTDAAKDYLLELVSRNLVSVAERTSMGDIKACRVHDLLHELCRAKANEEHFLHVVKDLDNASVNYEHHRVCIHSKRENFIDSKPSGEFVRSLLFFATRERFPLLEYDVSFISLNFKLLRTLKLESINIGDSLPDEIVFLAYLRFLAIRGTMISIPDSITRLSNLEIFSVKGLRGQISLPQSIWSLKRLRHLHVKDRCALDWPFYELSMFDNLESLSSVFLPYDVARDDILERLLSRLKRLKCIFSESWNETKNCNQFPVLNALVQLESLKVLYHGRVRHPSVLSYPATLKKLTLSKFRLPWKEISTIGSLPCLEVLKLLFKAFEGEEWEVGSEEFQNLKYLKLDSLDIVRWAASCDSFPCLQQIVLQSCKKLEEVPFAFSESPTLQTIQSQWCSKTVVKSVRDIQEEHMDTSGSQLNVFIHPPDC